MEMISMSLSLWENTLRLYAQHRIFLEILWTTSWWVPLLLPAYGRMRTPTFAKYAKLPYAGLGVHLLLGSAVLSRYYFLYATTGASPVPDIVDLVLGLAFAASSLQMSAHVHMGFVPVVRGTFQSMALQQAAATALGYAYGDAGWHRAAVKILDAFVWVRWLAHYAPLLQGFRTYGARFTAAVFVSLPLCLWEGAYPAGTPAFIALLSMLLAVDKWASRKLDGKPGPFPRALAHCGFVTVQPKHRENAETDAEVDAAGVKQE
ncbi:hypothetical protein CMUS01_10653 [Colletotrichum musicola]|uniref:Uncharacterized protein n=1 Tax=Colletotrichum musicola TaxID=2175873 RepID=A0A8H6N8F7_9PEZI|nr:hypothetical protein CMUS01_10653 [Colletotrichum musicola]